jgi:hypothetical protein
MFNERGSTSPKVPTPPEFLRTAEAAASGSRELKKTIVRNRKLASITCNRRKQTRDGGKPLEIEAAIDLEK